MLCHTCISLITLLSHIFHVLHLGKTLKMCRLKFLYISQEENLNCAVPRANRNLLSHVCFRLTKTLTINVHINTTYLKNKYILCHIFIVTMALKSNFIPTMLVF